MVAAALEPTREIFPLRAASFFHFFESACVGNGPEDVVHKPRVSRASVSGKNRGCVFLSAGGEQRLGAPYGRANPSVENREAPRKASMPPKALNVLVCPAAALFPGLSLLRVSVCAHRGHTLCPESATVHGTHRKAPKATIAAAAPLD